MRAARRHPPTHGPSAQPPSYVMCVNVSMVPSSYYFSLAPRSLGGKEFKQNDNCQLSHHKFAQERKLTTQGAQGGCRQGVKKGNQDKVDRVRGHSNGQAARLRG